MHTITFYSYKGGVGRSLALANIATRLAEFGKQVCMLEMDLDAPGLHHKFSDALQNNGIKIEKGFLDFVHDFIEEGNVPDNLRGYSYSWFPFPQSCLTLIPAGNTDGKYWRKLSSINWYDLLYENKNGPALFLHLKEMIRQDINPEFLLIDSRTGISEMSGIALSLFPDEVVVMAANNKENLEGAKKILKSLSNPENRLLDTPISVSLVLSRIPCSDLAEQKAREELLKIYIKKEFEGLVDDFNILHSDRDLEMEEQIKIGYDKDDSTSQLALDYMELFEKLMSGHLENEEFERFNNIKLSEKYFKKASQEISEQTKIELLDKAIDLNRRNTELYLSKIAILEKTHQWQKVVNVCDEIQQFETMDLRPFEIKANALLLLRREDEAEVVLNEVLRRMPNRLSAKYVLARIYIQKKMPDRALQLLDEIIEYGIQDLNPRLERARIRRGMSMYQEALEDVYYVLGFELDNAVALLLLAKIQSQLGNQHEFYLNFEKVLQLHNKLNVPIQDEIKADPIFKEYEQETRFKKIMERYNIVLLPEETN